MHSSIGPWSEAQQIYLAQSHLVDRILSTDARSDSRPFVIYDIGLGIAANALATLELLRATTAQTSPGRRVILMSFETDLEGIKDALVRHDLFPFLDRNTAIIQKLIESGPVSEKLGNGVEFDWELKVGDFRDHLADCPLADIIFFDLYSPKSCPALWGLRTFQALFQKAHALPKKTTRETLLITYSASTAARTALMLAGFYVGKGTSTAGKKETTLATTQFSSLESPLGRDWIEHWRRSSRPVPADYPDLQEKQNQSEILAKLLLSIQGN